MNTFDVIMKRRSIRKFKNTKISNELIEKLLISAMAAPSARNMQPWEFYVITDEQKLKNLRKISKSLDFNSPLVIIVCGNLTKRMTKSDNDFWIQDCSAAIENILLTATEENLGSLWCGLYPMVEKANQVRKIIEANQEIVPIALLHLGYPDEEKEPRSQYDNHKVHYFN